MNWEDFERLWDYACVEELQVETKEHSVLISEHPHITWAHRERMAEVIMHGLH